MAWTLNSTTNRAVVILGESGCGKSSLAKAILRLLPRNVEKYGGKVYLQGTDVMTFDEEEFRQNVRWAADVPCTAGGHERAQPGAQSG